LVYATVDRTNLKFINFPAHEEAQRPGYDGTTLIDIERTHVPKRLCYWELSCQGNPARKAQSDYETRVQRRRMKISVKSPISRSLREIGTEQSSGHRPRLPSDAE
jgi:hypothetical protein